MIKIEPPDFKVNDIIDMMLSDTSRAKEIIFLNSLKGVLPNLEEVYNKKGEVDKFFEIPDNSSASLIDSVTRYENLYDYKLLKRSNCKIFYERVLLSAPNNKCPYCKIRYVKTIDHYLPLSKYSSFSIVPINLIPCCRDCNIEKKVHFPSQYSNQLFHPYFYTNMDAVWLKAELKNENPICFSFKLVKPDNWSDDIFKKATFHFNYFKLNQLYSNEANRELLSMKKYFKALFNYDPQELKSFLHNIYDSSLSSLGPIDWKTLMYNELANSDWFCNREVKNHFFD